MDSLSLVKMFKWKHFKNNFIIYLSRAFKISEYLKCLCVTFIETCSKSDHFENNNFNVNCFRENTFKKKNYRLWNGLMCKILKSLIARKEVSFRKINLFSQEFNL